MELGLSTYSFHLAFGRHPDRKSAGSMTLAKLLNKARTMGFAAVQVDPMHFDADKDTPAWVKRMADGLGIRLEAGSMGIDKQRITRDLEVAAAWESPVLRTFLGSEHTCPGPYDEKELASTAKKIGEIIPEAEGLGITIALENHLDISSDDLAKLVDMVGSEHFGVCLDVANNMVFLEDPVKTAETLAPYAVTCHLKDLRWEPTNYGAKLTGAALGDGCVPLRDILSILKDAPRLGSVILEVPWEAKGTDREMLNAEEAAVKKSMDFWRIWSVSATS